MLRTPLPALPRSSFVLAMAALAAAVCAHSAFAEQASEFSGRDAVELRNGANEIDLDGDGTRDQVFVAHRENFNAHDYDAIAFYRHDPKQEAGWQLVPFDEGSQDVFRTREGADCTTGDLAILPPKDGKGAVTVIVAQREMNKTLADAEPVTFQVFALARNEAGIPGWPPFFFHRGKVLEAKAPYCDVREAMARELGIGKMEKRAR